MTRTAQPTSADAGGYAWAGIATMPAAKLTPSPICMIDLDEMYILSSSSPWTDIDLVMPPDHHLVPSVHPDDRNRVRAFLASAPSVPATTPSRTVIRMRGLLDWRATKMAALRLAGLVDGQQIMIRLS